MKVFLRILPALIGLAGTVVIGVLAVVSGAWYYLRPALPDAETLRDVRLHGIAVRYDD